jgi:hypothetical protein
VSDEDDHPTIARLREEARRNYHRARRRFLKWDNHDDMKEMECWLAALNWLKEKTK